MKKQLLFSFFVAKPTNGDSRKLKIKVSTIFLILSWSICAQETWTGSLTGTNQWGNNGCVCSGEFSENYSLFISSQNNLVDNLKCNSPYQGSATYAGAENVILQNSLPALCQLVGSSVTISDSLQVTTGTGFIQLNSLSTHPLVPGISISPATGVHQDDPIYSLKLHIVSFSANYVSGTWDCPSGNTCSFPHGTFSLSKVNSLPAAAIAVENKIVNNSTFFYPKTLWTGTTDQIAATLKICADGSTATQITYINNDQNINLNNIHFKIASDPSVSYPDYSGFFTESTSGNKKIATLNHPTYLSYLETPYRDDTILIVNNNSLCTAFKMPIRIYPAPIILVHGLWSSATVFQKMEREIKGDMLLPSELILSANYESTNDASFYENRNVVPDNITAVLMSARSNNFSAGKVDVVCHSMGGNLSRLYIQSSSYDLKRDIHKLITINTPHSGSHAANILLNPSSATSAVARVVAEPAIKLFSLSTHSSIFNGAVENLRIGSYAMDYINTTRLNNSMVPSHSIITENDLENDNLFYLIYSAAGALNFMSPTSYSNYLFFQNSNDMIVSTESQSGGLPWAASTYVQYQSHNGSPKNMSVIFEVIDALTTNSKNTSYFCQNGYAPISQETHYRSEEGDTSSLQLLPGSISINYPAPNQSFNPGDVIPVNISSLNGINKIMLQSINSGSNSSVLDTSMSSGIINYTVPTNAFGTLEFISFGFDANNLIDYDTVKININQTAALDSVSAYSDVIYVQQNKSVSVSTTAYFNNGYNYNVSNLPTVQYQIANAGLAKYDGYNLIKGLKVGTTTLTVTYLNKTKTITVVVIPQDLSSVDAEELMTSIADNKAGKTNSSASEITNVSVFPNPFSTATTIKYKISSEENVSVKVFDIYGHLVSNLSDAKQTLGEHKINFESNNLPEGVYIMELRTAHSVENKKLFIVR